jgi:hypothetical protein
MRYWNRNLISATKRPPTVNSASGIFDLISHQVYKGNGIWPTLVNDGLTTDGLYLHLDAGDSDSYSGSGTSWLDLTSNNVDFTLTNGPVYNSGFSGYFTFDGSNDYASTSTTSTNFGTDPFAIEIWHRSHTVADFEGIFSQDSGTAVNGTFQVDHRNGNLRFLSSGGSNNEVIGSSATNVLNTWKQIVFVREGTGANQTKIYLNGSLDTTGTVDTNLNVNDNFQIGRNRGNALYFDGDISIIRIYKNKALSAAEVAENYNNNRSRYSLFAAGVITDSLILRLDAGDSSSYSGSGTTWTDLSGNGNDATLVNGPTYSSANNGYLDFDGTNDHATLPQLSTAGNEISFDVWNYGISAQQSGLIYLEDSNGRDVLNVHLPWSDGKVYFDKGRDASNVDRMAKSASSSEYQGWHHWAFTANASTGSMKIYLDGSLWHSVTGKTRTLNDVTGPERYIARNSLYYHRAYIGNLMLYTKELSASEVLHNYNALKSRYS